MNLPELVKEITTLVEYCNTHKVSNLTGEELKNLVLKLASYNASLGPQVANLEREADLAEAHYDWMKEKIYKEERSKDGKISVDDAKSSARLETLDDRKDYLDKKFAYRSHAILRADVNNLIDACRSALSFLRQERDKS